MKKECIAMLLAGGQGSRLYVLTENMAKPAVPFGGKFRIIDFPLSNCANAGIDTVGVLTQYRPLELNRYIGSGQPWDLDRADGGVHILPPYQSAGGASWYKGTANAIFQNIGFVDMYDPEYVLILSGDHIYKMNYAKMLAHHKKAGADCTISVMEVPWEDAPRFGIMNVDENDTITEFEEKPAHPKSNLASMGIYVFTWKKLREYLIEDESDEASSNDFGKNIIPKMLQNGEKMAAYRFSGYWKDVGTLDSLWDANMDMLATGSGLDLLEKDWPIYGRSVSAPPAYLGVNARVEHSVVARGCTVEGEAENSVLSERCTVEEGASVQYSILMPGAVVKKDARVSYAIIGENGVVGEHAFVGAPPEAVPPEQWGITVLGPGAAVADDYVLRGRKGDGTMNGLHGIIFAYEKAPGLRELTEARMPGSVPFGGRYRVVDFMLSNMAGAGITDVGVVLHGNYQSLLDHIGSGKTWDMARKNGGLKLLPPFADARKFGVEEFRGKMEALSGVRSYLHEIRQKYVVLSDSDLIINLPLQKVLDAHIESGADITCVCTESGQFVENATYFTVNEAGRITETRCAPHKASGCRSLEIYLLSRDLLISLVDECAAQDKYSFRSDVLCAMGDKLDLRAFLWDGFAAQLRTVREYYERSMQLLDPAIRSELLCAERPILAKEDDEAASYIAPDSRCVNSLIADGCQIEGSVEGSILFPGVKVGKGSQVKNCILFKNTVVEDGVTLGCVIADKDVHIRRGGTLIGHESYPLAVSKGSIV